MRIMLMLLKKIRIKLINIVWIFQEKGLLETLFHIQRLIIFALKVILNINDKVEVRRSLLSKIISKKLNNKIKYGNFKGLKLYDQSWWGAKDKAAILLGLYEKEVLEKIMELAKINNLTDFIDIGAADGYYGVGVLHAGFFKHSHCFEISKFGREIITKNSIINGVYKKISVYGKLNDLLSKKIKKFNTRKNLILIDIEGAEFEMLTTEFIHDIKHCYLIIELHYEFLEKSNLKFISLKKRFKSFFDIEIISTGSRNPNALDDLKYFKDSDKWLICSEGRRIKGEWMVCIPKINS